MILGCTKFSLSKPSNKHATFQMPVQQFIKTWWKKACKERFRRECRVLLSMPIIKTNVGIQTAAGWDWLAQIQWKRFLISQTINSRKQCTMPMSAVLRVSNLLIWLLDKNDKSINKMRAFQKEICMCGVCSAVDKKICALPSYRFWFTQYCRPICHL